jgi:hypothetical protein
MYADVARAGTTARESRMPECTVRYRCGVMGYISHWRLVSECSRLLFAIFPSVV